MDERMPTPWRFPKPVQERGAKGLVFSSSFFILFIYYFSAVCYESNNTEKM